MRVPFIKMHGLGNDFVILDARKNGFRPAPAQIRRIADRRHGVGCDQLILLEKPRNPQARLYMGIFNADGSVSGACGNATRCVALLEKESGAPEKFFIESDGAMLAAEVGKSISIDMGPARTGWKDIPLKAAGDLGAQIETDPLFPERTNVEFVSVKDRHTLRMRVWERGAGITQACGSGACAVLVAAVRRDLAERKATVIADGGALSVTWLENDHVLLEGPASYSFAGEISEQLLKDSA
ncbi:MAG: diaminopimelate epimerase [Proteobacteria bacterium]|nr:diaminopimelate epimerase [Pseudomonadota bacterium]